MQKFMRQWRELEKKLNQMMNIVTELETHISKLNTHSLNRKKSMLHRPRTKRTFKLIKR